LSLCAQAYPSAEVARQVRVLGLMERCADNDVQHFREANAKLITEYADRHAQSIVKQCIRSKRPYRIAELDRLLGYIVSRIPTLLEEAPNQAAQLTNVYLRGSHQIAEEMGQLQSAPAQNRWIVMIQNAPPDEKKALIGKMMELEQEARKYLPEAVIEGEFTAEE